MANPKYIIVGQASTNNKTGGSAAAGDQAQSSTPDYSGEVLLKKMSVSEFNSTYGTGNSRGTWYVIRPRDDSIANSMAQLMIAGCNNPHIGYLYGGAGLTSRGGANKIDTKKDTVTDCSGMVSQAVTEACGKNFNAYSSDIISVTAGFKIGTKNVFYNSFIFKSYDTKPVFNGDILRVDGHVAMVVGGVPRDGTTDTNPGTGGGGTGGLPVSYNGNVHPIGDWMSGWGLTIFAAKGDSGQPNGYGVANPSVNCKGTSILDDKGFISVAAGKEWPFNTRFEIKELPGVVFQVDDRGNSSLFDGQKHLDVFTKVYHQEEYVTTSDNKKVGLLKFAGAHQWPNHCDLHIREVSSSSNGGSGYTQDDGSANADGQGGYIDLDVEYDFVPRTKHIEQSDEAYKEFYQPAYKGEYGKGFNGSYAWARFSEANRQLCQLSKGKPKTWFSHKEDNYPRGAVPSLGAVMCFVNITDAGDPGFVCIVEIVHSEYIYVSYADAKNNFHYQKLTQKDGTWNLDLDKDGTREYLFQGFIYCPFSDQFTTETSTLQRFIETALKYEGKGAKYTQKYTGVDPKKDGWSAAFINAVAQDVGNIIGVVLPDTNSVSAIGQLGVEGYAPLGDWFDGPAQNGKVFPQIGDIILLRTDTGKKKRINRYAADVAGIVTSVTTASNQQYSKGTGINERKYKIRVTAADFNAGVVKTQEYFLTSKYISGVYRPYWNRVDGVSERAKWVRSSIGMYNEGTTIEDAAIRDIAYIEKTSSANEKLKKSNSNNNDEKSKSDAKSNQFYQPSIKKTGITLSAINYTGLLSNMYSVLVSLKSAADDGENLIPDFWNYTAISEFDIDLFATEPHPVPSTEFTVAQYREGLSDDTKIGQMIVTATSRCIFNTLYEELENKAAVVGVMAVLWKLSMWDPAKVDKGIGLLQWTSAVTGANRQASLKEWCKNHGTKKSWKDNLSGQLTFIIHEGQTVATLKKCWKQLPKLVESVSGAETAAEKFCKSFVYENKTDGTAITSTSTVSDIMYAFTTGAANIAFTAQLTELYEYCDTIWRLFIGRTDV